MPTAAEMPRYRCHKIVWALEIKTFRWDPTQPQGGYLVTPADIGYADVHLSAAVFARYTPKPGDFIVQYDDGYWSVSPRKAFLGGYTPITPGDKLSVDTPLVDSPNATGWLDQRSQPDHAVQELRRWALEQVADARSTNAAIEAAAEFEAYVLNGAPAKTDTDPS